VMIEETKRQKTNGGKRLFVVRIVEDTMRTFFFVD